MRPLSYGNSIRCLSWYRCAFPSCLRIKTVICACASIVIKPLLQAEREMNFAARSARTSLMSTNQERRKRKIHRIATKKCLRYFGDCGILSIKKGICVNRCPTGATDRRLARLNDYDKNSRLTLAEQGGYFCVLLLSLPIEYPIPKQVKPKLNTAISPKISIGSVLLSQIPLRVSMYQRYIVIEGTQPSVEG